MGQKIEGSEESKRLYQYEVNEEFTKFGPYHDFFFFSSFIYLIFFSQAR